MKRINIMTSCDDGRVKYIFPQLVSINQNVRDYDVHFYLVHSRIGPEAVGMLESFIKEKTNLTFHDIKVTENIQFYQQLVKNGGGQWPLEAYITLRVQDYLPEDVDRILYIDSGDVIIDGDISPYYFDTFNGCSLIATPLGFKTDPVTKKQVLYTKDDILQISKSGSLFNSGSYVIDVEKFRREGYSVDDYLFLSNLLVENSKPGEPVYFGDQGYLAAAFVGDVKFFGYPKYKTPSYMPYNFRSAFWGLFGGEPAYKPVILHYALISKPWVVRFSDDYINQVIASPQFVGKYLIAPIPPLAYMTPQHLRLCEVWWKYAKETPIYEEANTAARITADCWANYYIPMCTQYINACIELKGLNK